MLPLTSAASDDFRGSLAAGAVLSKSVDVKYVAGSASEEVFWLLGQEGIARYDSLVESEPAITSRRFSDGGYCVLRDGWDQTDNCMIVDCGEVGSLPGGHGHADSLSIEVAVHGKTLLIDPGTYTYHESREVRDHFRSSAAHNTVTIDGNSSSEPGDIFGWETRANCVQKNWISNDRFDFFEGTQDGYERLESPATHSRSILFLKGHYWIMRDHVNTTGHHDIGLNFHYAPDVGPIISQDGTYVGDMSHRIYTFGQSGSWQKYGFEAASNKYGSKAESSLFTFRSKRTGIQEFFTFILPVVSDAAPPEVSEISTTHGRAFAIKHERYRDVIVFNDGEQIHTEMFSTDFNYSWARTSNEGSLPDEFVLINGGRFKLGERNILDVVRMPFATARRLGEEIYLRTEDERRTVAITERRKADRSQPSSDARRPFSW